MFSKRNISQDIKLEFESIQNRDHQYIEKEVFQKNRTYIQKNIITIVSSFLIKSDFKIKEISINLEKNNYNIIIEIEVKDVPYVECRELSSKILESLKRSYSNINLVCKKVSISPSYKLHSNISFNAKKEFPFNQDHINSIFESFEKYVPQVIKKLEVRVSDPLFAYDYKVFKNYTSLSFTVYIEENEKLELITLNLMNYLSMFDLKDISLTFRSDSMTETSIEEARKNFFVLN
ncbi:MAG: hypothetical protein VX028_03285 [Nanoarchaeota archaeon]|nr:hypothetical protein [Nanoarchaeota archaeon]MEC8339031.1 hypothetical protein [Nanoarchaeota archaeon]